MKNQLHIVIISRLWFWYVIKSSSSEHKMDMMMCPMHGMVDMNHKHDDEKKDNKKIKEGIHKEIKKLAKKFPIPKKFI